MGVSSDPWRRDILGPHSIMRLSLDTILSAQARYPRVDHVSVSDESECTQFLLCLSFAIFFTYVSPRPQSPGCLSFDGRPSPQKEYEDACVIFSSHADTLQIAQCYVAGVDERLFSQVGGVGRRITIRCGDETSAKNALSLK